MRKHHLNVTDQCAECTLLQSLRAMALAVPPFRIFRSEPVAPGLAVSATPATLTCTKGGRRFLIASIRKIAKELIAQNGWTWFTANEVWIELQKRNLCLHLTCCSAVGDALGRPGLGLPSERTSKVRAYDLTGAVDGVDQSDSIVEESGNNATEITHLQLTPAGCGGPNPSPLSIPEANGPEAVPPHSGTQIAHLSNQTAKWPFKWKWILHSIRCFPSGFPNTRSQKHTDRMIEHLVSQGLGDDINWMILMAWKGPSRRWSEEALRQKLSAISNPTPRASRIVK